MKIAVIGSAGFLGQNIVKTLKESTVATVLQVDNLLNPASVPNNETIIASMEEVDYSDCNYIINCGAYSAINETLEGRYLIDLNNIHAPYNLFSKLDPQTRIIQISSAAVHGKSFYGQSKKFIDDYLLKYYPNSLVIRLQNLFGPGQKKNSLAYGVIQKFYDDPEINLVFPGFQSRSFIHVKDAAALIVKSLITPYTGIFSLSGPVVSMDTLANQYCKIVNKIPGNPGLLAPVYETYDIGNSLGYKINIQSPDYIFDYVNDLRRIK